MTIMTMENIERASIRRTVLVYAICILIPLIGGGISAYLSNEAMLNYNQAIKPPFAPPAWVFPVAWSILYTLMGIFSARIYLSDSFIKKEILTIYAIHLIINFSWSIIYFNFSLYWIAFTWILGLIIAIVTMMNLSKKIDTIALYCMVPYLLWCIFAGYLNFMTAMLN